MDLRIGLDIAAKVDFTAIAVVEVIERETGRIHHSATWHREHGEPGWVDCQRPYCSLETEDVFHVRDLGRLERHTPYRGIARHTARVVADLNDRGHRPRIFADATGIGSPLIETLTEELYGLKFDLSEVIITSGQGFDGVVQPRMSVPKFHIWSRLKGLIEDGRLWLPDTDRTKALQKELRDFRLDRTDAGNITANARSGAHDDLVIATGLACLTSSSAGRIVKVATPYR